MACRNAAASSLSQTRPIVSARGTLRPSHFFQNGAQASVSKALRLPSRAQNNTRADGPTTDAGMRGFGRLSPSSANRRSRRP